jgi:hypothetical protein
MPTWLPQLRYSVRAIKQRNRQCTRQAFNLFPCCYVGADDSRHPAPSRDSSSLTQQRSMRFRDPTLGPLGTQYRGSVLSGKTQACCKTCAGRPALLDCSLQLLVALLHCCRRANAHIAGKLGASSLVEDVRRGSHKGSVAVGTAMRQLHGAAGSSSGSSEWRAAVLCCCLVAAQVHHCTG